jgi:rhomboid protease GluP
MPDSVLPTHEALLRLCAAAAPKPWSPRTYAQESGVPRDSLDGPLNDLRLAGLVRLTEWESGAGQGYVLTDFGQDVLKNPVALAQLRAGLRAPAPEARLADNDEAPSRPLTRFERGEVARKALHDPEPPRVVPILILINVIAFAASLFVAMQAGVPANQFLYRGDTTSLHQLGALRSTDLVNGEWWRLITCCFLHFGAMHLFVNMYSLHCLRLLESLWGPWRFLLLYMAAGLGGSCAAMVWYDPTREALNAGASGAIWGLMASLAAWLFMNRGHLPPREWAAWMQRLGVVIFLNFLVSFVPGISAAAHFGGGAVGFIMGSLLHVQRFAVSTRKTAATILIVMLPPLCVYAVADKMKSDPKWQSIADREKLARQRAALVRFHTDVAPAVDKADAAAVTALEMAYPLTDAPVDKRPQDKLAEARAGLETARALVRDALAKLSDPPPADEKLAAAYESGKNYMQSLAAMLDRVDELLEKNGAWDKDERSGFEAKRRAAQKQWVDAKNDVN